MGCWIVFVTVILRVGSWVAAQGLTEPPATTELDTSTLGSTVTLAPVINATVGKLWNYEVIKVANGSISTYHGALGDSLNLTCEEPYPIQWHIQGWIWPPGLVEFRPPRRNWRNGTWQLELNLLFGAAEFPGLTAVATISCVDKSDFSNRGQVAVFVKGRGNRTLIRGEDEGNKIIPCWSTDPNADAPRLFKGREEIATTWNALEGFRNRSGAPFAPGNYTCQRGQEKLNFGIETAAFAPAEDLVQIWIDQQLEVRCGGPIQNKTVKISTDNLDLLNVTVIRNEINLEIQRLQVKNPGKDVVSMRLLCQEGGNKQHDWTIRFLPYPELVLDNVAGEADCFMPASPKVQSLRCRDANECQFLAVQCLGKDATSPNRGCDWKNELRFHSKNQSECRVPSKDGLEECVSLPFSHLNGLLECGVEGKMKRWSFFIGLDYKRYFNRTEAPKNALVRLEVAESGAVVCTAAAYLFAEPLSFHLEHINGTSYKVYLHDNTAINELYLNGTLEAWPPEVVAITCRAAYWDSTEIAERRLERPTEATPPPAIPQVEWRTVVADVETFFLGAKDQELKCTAQDKQQKNFIWYYQKPGEQERKNATKVFRELEVKGGNLRFPDALKDHEGHYFCSVSTSPQEGEQLGSIERAFKLLVVEEPTPPSYTVWMVAVIILVVVAVGEAVAICFLKLREIRDWVVPATISLNEF